MVTFFCSFSRRIGPSVIESNRRNIAVAECTISVIVWHPIIKTLSLPLSTLASFFSTSSHLCLHLRFLFVWLFIFAAHLVPFGLVAALLPYLITPITTQNETRMRETPGHGYIIIKDRVKIIFILLLSFSLFACTCDWSFHVCTKLLLSNNYLFKFQNANETYNIQSYVIQQNQTFDRFSLFSSKNKSNFIIVLNWKLQSWKNCKPKKCLWNCHSGTTLLVWSKYINLSVISIWNFFSSCSKLMGVKFYNDPIKVIGILPRKRHGESCFFGSSQNTASAITRTIRPLLFRIGKAILDPPNSASTTSNLRAQNWH